jgi:hydrogenase/urease accessory protein HupE
VPLTTPRHSGVRHGLLRLARRAAVLAGAITLFAASPASAHGIGGDAATASIPGFVGIGIEHMLLGWDHLLFVAGIVLLAGSARRGAKVISAFVVGHSLTLITATLAGWQVNAGLVDVVIVLSVAFVGMYGMFGRPRRWDVFTAIVFAFGLAHGLGLSTRFQALGVADEGMVWRLIAFNVGIEIGQLTAIMGFLAIAAVVSMLFKNRHDVALTKVAFVALFAVGSMTAPFLALNEFRSVDGDVSKIALPDDSGCTVSERTEPFPASGGGHTEKTFYEPGETVPIENFGHSLGDGYIVVLYPETLSEQDVDLLRDFVTDSDPAALLAGAREDASGQVAAITANQQMTCEGVHVGALRQFSRTWLASIGEET